jgi:hypothetical protein
VPRTWFGRTGRDRAGAGRETREQPWGPMPVGVLEALPESGVVVVVWVLIMIMRMRMMMLVVTMVMTAHGPLVVDPPRRNRGRAAQFKFKGHPAQGWEIFAGEWRQKGGAVGGAGANGAPRRAAQGCGR